MELQSRIQSPASDSQLTEVPGRSAGPGLWMRSKDLKMLLKSKEPPPVLSMSPGIARDPSQSDGLSSEPGLRS